MTPTARTAPNRSKEHPLLRRRLALGAAASYDAATKDDKEFNATFQHKFATVRGVRMHYVTRGKGPALVLLHDRIGLDDFGLVAHDLGAGVGAQ
ncbi:hypothetical protein [Streptomyces sp. NPDC005865]|uniref:hypothetical protein n=1 Tax=Streptomyces sp. NPDC005865 TaxID=3155453 RepID=UPI0033C3023D